MEDFAGEKTGVYPAGDRKNGDAEKS